MVVQENSYYAFGLTFATSPVGTPAKPNKNLYNGGSEWQNDFSNSPDYYQTFFRNYDQALGRFVSLDPMAEAAESLTGYNYSGNNPVMFNDPLGDVYADDASWIPRHVDANGIPAGDPGYGGGGGGGGSLWAFGSGGGWGGAFQMMGVYDRKLGRQLGDKETSYGLLRAARSGNLAAIAQYVAQMGATTITDPKKIIDYFFPAASDDEGSMGILLPQAEITVSPLSSAQIEEEPLKINGILLDQAEIRDKKPDRGFFGLNNLPALRNNELTWSRKQLNDGAIEQLYWVGGEALGPLVGAIKWAPRIGRTFAEYKLARGGTKTLTKIATSTGTQRISTEFHHVFITQRMQKAYNLPNWLVNNQLNVWKLNTIQHSLIDSHRFNFLRAGIKPEVGWFGKYNWFTKF